MTAMVPTMIIIIRRSSTFFIFLDLSLLPFVPITVSLGSGVVVVVVVVVVVGT